MLADFGRETAGKQTKEGISFVNGKLNLFITNGGKIMGLKLFQQISANILKSERKFAGLEWLRS